MTRPSGVRGGIGAIVNNIIKPKAPIAPTINYGAVPEATETQAGYSLPATISGMGTTVALKAGSGPLPPSLAVDPVTGDIEGDIDAGTAETYGFIVEITDVVGQKAEVDIGGRGGLVVNPAPVVDTDSPLPDAVEGEAYSAQISKTGGTGDGEWSVDGAGAADLAASGLEFVDGLDGFAYVQPVDDDPDNLVAGPATFTATFVDDNGVEAEKEFTVTVLPPQPPWISEGWAEHYYAAGPEGAEGIGALFQDTGKTSPVTADNQAIKAIEVYDGAGALFDDVTGATDGWKYAAPGNANCMNDRPGMYFDGTQGVSILRAAAKQLQQWATDNLKFTYHFPFKLIAGITDNKAMTGPVSSGGGNGPGARYDTDGGGVIRTSGFMSGFQTEDIAIPDGNPHVYTVRCDGESGNVYTLLDGAAGDTYDIDALGETELVAILGAANIAVGTPLFHDGDDANMAAHITAIKAWYGVA